jgi:hypothetical protein
MHAAPAEMNLDDAACEGDGLLFTLLHAVCRASSEAEKILWHGI